MGLNRQGCCRLLSVRRHVSGAPTPTGKLVVIQFVQKRHGLKFASSLDCEGDGHFQELLVTTSHLNDNPARAPANECLPGE
jgi:hypothetical protein